MRQDYSLRGRQRDSGDSGREQFNQEVKPTPIGSFNKVSISETFIGALHSNNRPASNCPNNRSRLRSRVNGRGLPLFDTHKDVALQCVRFEDKRSTVYNTTSGSHKKAWFQCPKDSGHVWKSRIDNRVAGRGCPLCAKASNASAHRSQRDQTSTPERPCKKGNTGARLARTATREHRREEDGPYEETRENAGAAGGIETGSLVPTCTKRTNLTTWTMAAEPNSSTTVEEYPCSERQPLIQNDPLQVLEIALLHLQSFIRESKL